MREHHGPRHREAKTPKTCSVCARPFLAKSPLAATCYEEACQVEARRRQKLASRAQRSAGQ